MIHVKRILGVCVLVATLFGMTSCATAPVVIPEDMQPAEFFNKAQEAMDWNYYDTARIYYETLIARFPNDVQNVIAAQYELAYISYREGNLSDAEARFNGIIAQYEGEGQEALPRWPLILSQKILAKIESEKTAKADNT